MTTAQQASTQAVQQFLRRMGDNTLILGHRISEWCGHSPVLEEDIAMANVALDLIGQTQYWLGMAAEREGKGRTADHLAYLRDAHEFRNVLLVEQPNRDYACTLMRQFMFDVWHLLMLSQLQSSSDREIADVAGKAIKEVSYHAERSADLVIRLGDGSEESHRRMQKALDELWHYSGEMFDDDAIDVELAEAGVAPLPSSLQTAWQRQVAEVLEQATLNIPDNSFMHRGGRQGRHTEHLGYILAEMQFLQRAYPGCNW